MLIEGQTLLLFWRKTCLFTELNTFVASTKRTTSACTSLYTLDITWTAAPHPNSHCAHACNSPTFVIMSSGKVDTIIFPTILLSASPTPIGYNPGFLLNRIRRQDRKSSRVFARSLSVYNFFIILAMVVHISVELSANYLHVRILFQNWWHFLRFDFGSAVFLVEYIFNVIIDCFYDCFYRLLRLFLKLVNYIVFVISSLCGTKIKMFI